jgi:hypothetical protein
MPGPSTPAQNTGRRIAEVFKTMVNDLAIEMDKAQHEFAVDMEIEFKSVTLDQRGIPLFSKSTTQSQLQIKIATRITPPAKK